jgi:hypothetical protein
MGDRQVLAGKSEMIAAPKSREIGRSIDHLDRLLT